MLCPCLARIVRVLATPRLGPVTGEILLEGKKMRQMFAPDRAYTVREFAEKMSMPRPSVYDLIRTCEIVSVQYGNGRRKSKRILGCDANDFIRSNSTTRRQPRSSLRVRCAPSSVGGASPRSDVQDGSSVTDPVEVGRGVQ